MKDSIVKCPLSKSLVSCFFFFVCFCFYLVFASLCTSQDVAVHFQRVELSAPLLQLVLLFFNQLNDLKQVWMFVSGQSVQKIMPAFQVIVCTQHLIPNQSWLVVVISSMVDCNEMSIAASYPSLFYTILDLSKPVNYCTCTNILFGSRCKLIKALDQM